MSPKKQLSLSSQPSYSFHGSNSSHSKDNGSGGRTYHVPNYATSYANEKSNLIAVSFDEDKGASKAIIAVVVIFLLFAAVPFYMTAWKPSPSAQAEVHPTSPATPEPPLPVSNVQDWQPDPWLSAKKEDIKNEEPPLQEAHRESKPDKISPHDNHKARGLYWDEPQPSSRCLAFGTREYTARLWNVPFYAKWVEACEHTEVMIHGIIVPKPSSCESKWPFGGVIGHWIINFGEDDCLARWGKVTDKGCVEPGSKLRRFQSRLWGIKKGEDWMTLCKTAPASIHGISTLKPTTCEDQGLWGVYGVWDLEDGSC